MNTISKVAVWILVIFAAIIVFINIFIPPVNTITLLVPWILLLFAFLFLICARLDAIIMLLEDVYYGDYDDEEDDE